MRKYGRGKSVRSFLEENYTVSFSPRGFLILFSAELVVWDPKSRDSHHLWSDINVGQIFQMDDCI